MSSSKCRFTCILTVAPKYTNSFQVLALAEKVQKLLKGKERFKKKKKKNRLPLQSRHAFDVRS